MEIRHSEAGDEVILSGQINLYNCTKWSKKTDELLRQVKRSNISFNLAQINDADSAILTLMLTWLRIAKTFGITVAYSQVPAHVVNLSVLYGIRDLLPIISEGK